jgi:hypothetical protein
MAKRPSLFAALAQHAPSEPDPLLPAIAARKTVRPLSREGKRVLSIYLPPEAWKQLRMLSLDLEISTWRGGDQSLVREAPVQPHRLTADMSACLCVHMPTWSGGPPRRLEPAPRCPALTTHKAYLIFSSLFDIVSPSALSAWPRNWNPCVESIRPTSKELPMSLGTDEPSRKVSHVYPLLP